MRVCVVDWTDIQLDKKAGRRHYVVVNALRSAVALLAAGDAMLTVAHITWVRPSTVGDCDALPCAVFLLAAGDAMLAVAQLVDGVLRLAHMHATDSRTGSSRA
jgi:diphthamide biosynthesis methyltransferase